ncbi:MAG: hypothetical protein EAZ44_08040 [Cytophagia bacterium]|nr:MAG: hypothetical protein EAZ44_08040 [Cytophagia bacterium]TAG38994.1 MAG: hypothetical protein EAZ31_09800 [Cytophagia bacterium]TAH30498.1 MAG: hypothetical protein EAZ06_03195 [Cytophagales bacterium]
MVSFSASGNEYIFCAKFIFGSTNIKIKNKVIFFIRFFLQRYKKKIVCKNKNKNIFVSLRNKNRTDEFRNTLFFYNRP